MIEDINDPVIKPWGSYTVLSESESNGYHYLVKEIAIAPLQSISLQSHKLRDETWRIVSGNGIMELENSSFTVDKNSRPIFIKVGEKHRITNDNDEEWLIFVEIQFGTCREEDIIRYKDQYNRL